MADEKQEDTARIEQAEVEKATQEEADRAAFEASAPTKMRPSLSTYELRRNPERQPPE